MSVNVYDWFMQRRQSTERGNSALTVIIGSCKQELLENIVSIIAGKAQPKHI